MSKTCSSCGESIAQNAKKCKHCGTDLRNWFVRHYIIITFSVLIVIGIIGSASGGSTFEEPVANREYVDISCADFSQKFGMSSDLTNLQREELFKSTYKNKYVDWSGEVAHIDNSFGMLSVQIKCLSSTFVSDAIVSFPESEKEKLLGLSEGQQIHFEARLENWGELLATSLDRGKILD